jgi:hypothetical protein
MTNYEELYHLEYDTCCAMKSAKILEEHVTSIVVLSQMSADFQLAKHHYI